MLEGTPRSSILDMNVLGAIIMVVRELLVTKVVTILPL